MPDRPAMRDVLMAEFSAPEQLVRAIRAMREKGYCRLDAYTPYPLFEVEQALALRRSRLPWAIFLGGMAGAGGAYFLQWYLVAYLYPLNVGGRPPHFPLAFVPITFEMGVLFAGITAFLGVLAVSRMPRLWDPVFEVEGFERATIDRFWLQVATGDPRFREESTPRELEDLGALRVVHLRREEP